MNKEFRTIGAFIIASAIIWAAVIVGSSYVLKGISGPGLVIIIESHIIVKR